MILAVHDDRPSLDQRCADGVGPDGLLRIREPGREVDAVEALSESSVPDPPVDDRAGGVAKYEGDGRIGQVGLELVENRGGGQEQGVVTVGLVGAGGVELFGAQAGSERSLPGIADLLTPRPGHRLGRARVRSHGHRSPPARGTSCEATVAPTSGIVFGGSGNSPCPPPGLQVFLLPGRATMRPSFVRAAGVARPGTRRVNFLLAVMRHSSRVGIL